MAEQVIFGGSPLDQYLRDAHQPDQQPSVEDDTRSNNTPEPSTPGAASFRASTPAGTPVALARSRDTASPASVVSNGSAFIDSTPIPPPSAARNGPAMPSSSNQASSTPRIEHARSSHSPQAATGAYIGATAVTPSSSSSAAFSSQFTDTLRALIQRFFLPLVLMIAQDVFGLRQAHTASTISGHPSPQLNAYKSYARAATNESSDEGSTSFVERFKYAICSSFLLTPSLSISFYESSPPFQSQSPTADPTIKGQPWRNRVSGRRASTTPVYKQCYVEPEDALASILPCGQSPTAVTNERLPRLDAQGRTARNAALLSAIFLLPPISKSWQLWFSSLLLIASLTWGFILFLGHSSLDDRIHFTLSHKASPTALTSATSLRALRTTNELGESEKAALQRSVLTDVSSLIKAAQRFDVSINKAISAIQEVEIVSRGYKLTHPLPPISRIEAASAQSSNWSNLTSSPRQRRSMVASFVPATGKLARSLSGGGNGAPTIKRHTQRPLSLTLSNGRASPLDRTSGRASPAAFAEAGDVDLNQRLLAEQSDVALAAGRSAPQRLVELRKCLVLALDDVGAACTSSTASLQMLADAEELALLQDLYALDATSQDDANDADADVDASHAWSNGDTSALSEGSPDLEQDRKAWVATTPRNFGSNVRSADVSAFSDIAWRPEYSPQTGSHHKRLSLISDGGSVLDRQPRATSSLSRRSSLVSESGNIGAYRSPRFNYVSDKSATPSGPNESAAAKRLSYISNSSVATGSLDTRSPVMRNSSIVSSTFSPPHSSVQTYSAATSPQSRATKRSSILGPNSIFAQIDTSIPALGKPEPADPLSLLSIKAKFEWMHRARRRWLCHLLALRLTMDGDISLADEVSMPCDEYWTAARSTIESLRSTLVVEDKSVTEMVAKEMGADFFTGSKADATSTMSDKNVRAESRNGLLAVPTGEAGSVAGHPGIEDRLHAMMLSLRSLQSKIRVCAEDIRVKAPPGLHGIDDESSSSKKDKPAQNRFDDAAATPLQLEKTLESMRDDLLGLSAEWEATVKLVHKEKRRSPSPHLSTDAESDVAKANAARDLESPLEADEDAAASPHGQNGDDHLAEDGGMQLRGGQASDDEDDDDTDLAELLLRSTSPNSLPPPGLEQVFESIAGLAGLSRLEVDGKKLTRAERIEQARRQRQLEQDKQASEKASHQHTMDPSGMMSELSDVIQSRKAIREQRHHSAMPGAGVLAWQQASAQSTDQPALALGSPLDLGPAGQEGVFGASHSYSVVVDDQAVPRRSLSSLDLARARALQTLESRSPSVASSNASLSFESRDENQPRLSAEEDFTFEPTALESVPEDEAATALAANGNTASILPLESPSTTTWDSTSRKSTPKASHAPLSISSAAGEATPGPDSPFDLGAQVAAYARRQKAAKAQAAAALQASGSDSSLS
ncbi:uncharacterized protein UTRI_06114_B [Ustilago trichophora]|uniref:Myosin-binding domain-containing protein n=1 Tax=Ustilago trichophora TaxID=86804 RepID=A0A5C3EJY5_9BASI|nr:uncharacterized protein UTRI_06114_B [Ustilago trichophora]